MLIPFRPFPCYVITRFSEVKQLFEKIGIAKFKDRQYLIKLERIRKGRDVEFQLGLGTKPAAPAAGDQRIIILNMERDSEQNPG